VRQIYLLVLFLVFTTFLRLVNIRLILINFLLASSCGLIFNRFFYWLDFILRLAETITGISLILANLRLFIFFNKLNFWKRLSKQQTFVFTNFFSFL